MNLIRSVGVGILGLCLALSGVTIVAAVKDKASHQQKYSMEIKNKKVKAHHIQNLQSEKIKTNLDSLRNLDVVTDDKGNSWIYCSFLESGLLIDQVREKYSKEAALSFNDVQERLMDDLSKKGDTMPGILINEDLDEAKFIFTREGGKGETIKKELTFDEESQTWSLVQ